MKFAPLITTLVPGPPCVGVKPMMRGATVKAVALVAVPLGVVTVSGPVDALAGTVAVICVLVSTWKLAAVPLNRTAVAPPSAVPVIVTLVPTAPALGARLAIAGLTVKDAPLAAEPAGVVTPIFPVVAPAGTVAVILVGVTAPTAAGVPLNVTDVAPVKFAPAIATLAPMTAPVGEKLVIRGATVNGALVAVPPGVVTAMAPVVALAGTVVVIREGEMTVKAAAMPLNLTELTPVKFDPVITTLAPAAPLVGETPVIAGACVTVKSAALVAVPADVATAMRPLLAPAGTAVVIFTAETTVKLASAPLNATDVAPVKLAPLIATLVPVVAADGVKLVILGATVNAVVLEPVPAGATTLIGPVVALAGTVAVICALESTWNVARMPLNRTAVAPVKFAPDITTLAPTAPPAGVKPVMRGATANAVALAAEPNGVVTVMGPVVAAAGTVAVVLVEVLIVKAAVVPLKATDVAPARFVPLIVTAVPGAPLAGEMLVIDGGTPTENADALVAVPESVVTAMAPVVAP